MIEVIVVDDHPITRLGLYLLLDNTPDINFIGEAECGTKALDLVNTLKPDILLLDFCLPDITGAQLTTKIQKLNLKTRVLGFSAYSNEAQIIEMLDAGAQGYVLKTDSPDMLLDAIKAVAKGGTWLSPTIARKVLCRRNFVNQNILSGRELEVLQLLTKGYSNFQIANSLIISTATVKNHLTNIYKTLGVCSRGEAITWAWTNGLVPK